MYCDIVLFGSIAKAALTKYSAERAVSSNRKERRFLVCTSRKVLDSLNDNLGLVFQRDLRIAVSAKVHAYCLAAR
jgi:hypothetical protein